MNRRDFFKGMVGLGAISFSGSSIAVEELRSEIEGVLRYDDNGKLHIYNKDGVNITSNEDDFNRKMSPGVVFNGSVSVK